MSLCIVVADLNLKLRLLFLHIPTKWKNLKEFECGKDAISKPEVST